MFSLNARNCENLPFLDNFDPKNKSMMICFRTLEDISWLQDGFLDRIGIQENLSTLSHSCSCNFYFDFGFGLQNIVFYKLPDENSLAVLRNELGNLCRSISKESRHEAILCLPESCYNHDLFLLGQVISEAFVLSTYSYLYKKEMKQYHFASCELIVQKNLDTNSLIQGGIQGEIIARHVNEARNLCTKPANLLTPSDFLAITKESFENSDVVMSVIDEKEALKRGMHAFLGVGKGSSEASYMICLEYGVSSDNPPITLVGKGVTFDSGGISIKPSKSMSEMKADMSGAACVLSAFKAIVEMGLNKSVMAIIPLVENMPSGQALKPGDVIQAMNGKTIEVLNTDAEGRLILADALCLAVEKKSKMIIDIATLTGACVVALGTEATGLFSNNQEMIDVFQNNAVFTGENVWHMPLYDRFLEYLKSDVADISNCYEGRHGGACTAAKFLEQFVDQTPWVHLDMAPVMSKSKDGGICPKGMSAEGVRNLIAFLQHS